MSSRLPTPTSTADAPAASQPLLQAVQQQIGSVPNLFRLVANSPAALEGYLALSAALGKGSIPAATGERIALAVAEINGCGYCLSAHTYLGQHVAKLGADEMQANRAGGSLDARAAPAVAFAAKVATLRGHVAASDVEQLLAAGYTAAQVIEIVLHVALNTWTNYINEVAQTVIDFPAVTPRQTGTQA